MNSPNFFEPGSPFLNHPLLTEERTAQEIDFILSLLNIPPGARILDVGCGFGRHSIELARRGYIVLGIDPSLAMIQAARERAASVQPAPEFQQACGEDFRAQHPFDAAICLFTSLGQMDERGDNSDLVARVAAALLPGGAFVVEVPNRDWVIKNLKTFDYFKGVGECTYVDRSYDSNQHSVTEIFTIVSQHKRQNYVLRYRLFDLVELSKLIGAAGLEVVATFGGYSHSILKADSPVILMTARKPP